MALTDNCDLYASIDEDGINLVIRHIMRQRPSLFNYASDAVIADPNKWCSSVDYTKDVDTYENPIFTTESPIPIIGVTEPPVALDFCVQLIQPQMDFYPGNIISMPAELNPPLEEQHLALRFKLCGYIGCPSDDSVNNIGYAGDKEANQVVLPGKKNCFTFDVFAIGHFTYDKESILECRVDSIDIVDIKPDALEDNIICYLKNAANLFFKQNLRIFVESFFLHLPEQLPRCFPARIPPNNPAIEDDQLKVFINMDL